MSIVLLDPRFPKMIPVEAVPLLSQDVAYTEEVPVRVRWVIADLGGHTVDEAGILITTDISNELVVERIEDGEELIKAPSLLVEMEPDRELEAPSSSSASTSGDATSAAGQDAATSAGGEAAGGVAGTVVDGVIVGTDEHTAAVAGASRTTRTEVPAAVMDELEDAIALMSRALRQGEWEQSMTHESLLQFLKEETDELSAAIAARRGFAVAAGEGKGSAESDPAEEPKLPEFIEQDLCRELSDVLLQVFFHAELANRRGSFDIGHVAGAFSAKLRSRAPYLFEEVEREVPKDEQDKLWAEGKKREVQERRKTLAEAGRAQELDNYEELKEEARRHLAGLAARGADAPKQAEKAETPEKAGNAQPTPTDASALTEAEKVIAEARAAGLRDAEIPTDIRFPMVGLELDSPGAAEGRLLKAVEAFRASLGECTKG